LGNFHVTIQAETEREDLIMELRAQAEQIGFRIVGALVRRTDFEPSHLYQCFFDEAQNRYILHRGILTVVAADGTVY
jgi:hypothetical protein